MLNGSADNNDDENSKYWQPLPIWKAERWLGYAFSIVVLQSGDVWELGMIFDDADYGTQVFNSIAGWNHGNATDPDNNIGISFIIEDHGEYLAYVYPNINNEPEDHLQAVCIICKEFPNYPSSRLKNFQQLYDGGNFLLTGYYMKNNRLGVLPGITPVLKSGVKIKSAKDLIPGELEYVHRKKVIGRS
jgi:hypothetical protein